MNANGLAMSVVANNIANVNTVGFKGSSASFADILSQSLGSAAGLLQVGRGVTINAISGEFSQGSLATTTNPTDLAIEGSGFFIVGNDSGTYYTRAGQFVVDKEGYVVNLDGLRLQGYGLDSSGSVSAVIGDVNISQDQFPPGATTTLRIGANLEATAADNTTFSTTAVVYDSLGNALPLTITFTKVPLLNEWTWAASLQASAGTTTSTGTLTFDADGNLTNVADDLVDITGLTDGASDLTITWDLFDEAASATRNDLTGYASPSVASSVYQDGFAPGSLQSVSVGANGMITGLSDSGQTRDLGQLALADFTSPWGLARMGRSLFGESPSSGQANVNTPGAGGVGFITGNSLEMSNVDLATEFVNMIIYQRGYQASSRVVTVTDDMLEDVMNLKR